MGIKTLSIKDIIDEDEVEEKREESAGDVHAYVEYHIDDTIVLMEFVSKDISNEILGLFPADQKKVIARLVEETGQPGEQLMLKNRDGKRGSRVIRMATDSAKSVHLVVTH